MRESQKRSLKKAIEIMETYEKNLPLSDSIVQEGMRIFREAAEAGLLEGRSVSNMFAGSLYLAIKKQGEVIPPGMLVGFGGITRNQILRNKKYIQKELELAVEPVTPEPLIKEYGKELNFSQDTIDLALSIFEDSKEAKIVSGKSPRAFAAGSLYLAGLLNENTSQRDIVNVTGVTEVTVRNRYKEQMQVSGLEEEVAEAMGREKKSK